MKSREINRYCKWLLTFVGSFISGILIMNIAKNYFLIDGGILNPGTLSRIKYLNVDGSMLLRYSLLERGKISFILIIFSTTFIGIAVSYVFVMWQGILTGMFITAAVIRYGIKGVLLFMAGIFPQQILLIPAWVMLLNWCSDICLKFYFPHKDSDVVTSQKHYLMRKAIILLWIIGVIVIGCILESYVNPIFLTELLNLF
ncbi:MAG: stage II sporulation protein M [Lachnospiraceae bacterium]|nr:stage II sporulation protein M [Lachnospiraceae bacterium]